MAAALGMRVIGTGGGRRRCRTSPRCCRPSAPTRCWRKSDFVLLLLPATPETDNFINAERLAHDEARRPGC